MTALTVDTTRLHPPIPGALDDSDRPPVARRDIHLRRNADKTDIAARSALSSPELHIKYTLKNAFEAGLAFTERGRLLDQETLGRLQQEARAVDRELTAYLDSAKRAGKSAEGFSPYDFVHEVRSPLQSLLWLLEEGREGATAQALSRLYQTLDALAEEIPEKETDIIINLGAFDPRRLCDVVEAQMAPYAAKHGVFLHFHPEAIQDNLIGDRRQLAKLLRNLISNAIKNTPRGKRVDVYLELDQATESVRFTVKDEGRGISQKNQQKLFKPFSQVEGAGCWSCCFPKNVPSTGVGLNFCRKLAEKMNFERELPQAIGVHSIEGQGAAFWFLIPYTPEPKVAEDPPPITPSPVPVPTVLRPSLRYLVVDDVSTNRDTLSRMLKLKGNHARLEEAASEDEAVDKYIQALPGDPFHFVFLDLQMKGDREAGAKAARRIEIAARRALVALPHLFIVTGENSEDTRELVTSLGLREEIVILSKPISVRSLVPAINDKLRA